MPSRSTFYTEALATVAASGATRTTIATLTFLNKGGASYVMGGSWNLSRNIVDKSRSQLLYMETAATSTVQDYTWAAQELAAPKDDKLHFAFRKVTTPASSGTQTLRLQCMVSSAQSWAEIAQTRLFAIQTTANDAYGEGAGSGVTIQGGTTPIGTWTTICSAAFSAVANASYAVWGCNSINTLNPRNSGIRFTHQGTTMGGFAGYQLGDPPQSDRAPRSLGDIITIAAGGAGSNTIELQAGVSGISVTAYDARVMVWRAADFNAFTAITTDVTSNTSSATYVTAMASAVPMASGPRYAVFNHCYMRGQSITITEKAHLLIDTVTACQQILENSGSATTAPFSLPWQWYPMTSLTIVSASAGTHELRYRQSIETAGTGTDMVMQRIFVMQVEATAVAAGGGGIPGYYYHDRGYRI